MSNAEQWRALGRLTGNGLGAAVGIVRDTHAAVVQRVADTAPDSAAGAAAERSVADGVFDLVESAHRQVPMAAGHLAALIAPGVSPTRNSTGATLQAAVNGLWGDRIETDAAALAATMSVRHERQDVVIELDALREAFPSPTSDLVVFVHGLAEDESAWRLEHRGDATSYGERLAAEGFTALYVRYNTGRHISDNGRDLEEMLAALVGSWPVRVTSVSLVGHSMGGLVARSAAHRADARRAEWTPLLRTVISLGSPHLGAPLERAAHVVDLALRMVPESEPIGRVLANRSAGIKDLRFGSVLEQDWTGQDPDEFLRDRCSDLPMLPHVTYCWVSASITPDPEHPLGRLLGDGLVRYGSAGGRGHRSRTGFPIENGAHVGGVNHLRLLNHPAVYERLRQWLAAPAAMIGPA